jgi:chaperonin cofactor prefoldin
MVKEEFKWINYKIDALRNVYESMKLELETLEKLEEYDDELIEHLKSNLQYFKTTLNDMKGVLNTWK